MIERRLSYSISLCIGAILVLFFTELFYFDDTFTGINERLNTIFKLYYFCWIPFSLGAISFLCQQINKLPIEFKKVYFLIPSGVAVTAIMLAFFFQIASGKAGRSVLLTSYSVPRDEGLSSVDSEIKGSAQVIKKLRELASDLRVLERAEPAYSSAAILCSLSEHNCYIGWRNHLMMYYKDDLTEYDRRAGVSTMLYSPGVCEEKRQLALTEKIGAIVLSPKEKEIYPGIKGEDFNCFKESRTYGQITLLLP